MMRHVILISLLTLCIVLTVWVTNMEKIGVMEPFTYGEMLKEAQRHLIMVVIAEGIAIAIGVPLGILVTRPGFKWLATPVIGGANVGQTIPSLAVIAILATLPFTLYFLAFGLNLETAIVALVIYGLLPIVRNSYAGINNIDPATVEAARGMGMTRGQIARKIELPLALPVIMTGIRVSTVVIVGTATLCALIAAGGLGRIILAGVAVSEPLIILQGAAPTAALAITLGFILERIESWMTPRGLKVKAEVS
jgi:osmoprotectant transport system permease protein